MLVESEMTDCPATSSVTLNYGIFQLSNLTPTMLKNKEGTIKTQVKKQEFNLSNQLEITKMKNKKRFINMMKVSNPTNSKTYKKKSSSH